MLRCYCTAWALLLCFVVLCCAVLSTLLRNCTMSSMPFCSLLDGCGCLQVPTTTVWAIALYAYHTLMARSACHLPSLRWACIWAVRCTHLHSCCTLYYFPCWHFLFGLCYCSPELCRKSKSCSVHIALELYRATVKHPR